MKNEIPSCIPPLYCAAALIAALNGMPLRAADMIRPDPKTLDAYVGQYELGEAHFTFRRDGNILTCQVPREGTFQLEAKSDKHFVIKKSPDLGFTFKQNAKGKITSVVFHKEGEDFEIPKISDQMPQGHKPDISRIPPRDAKTGPKLVDLGCKYNSRLDDFWQPEDVQGVLQQNHLGTMPHGLQRLGTVDFDVRGIVQLCSTKIAAGGGLPKEVKDIQVNQKCRRLHFLQGTQWRVADGTRIGSYVLHYAGGAQAELPIVYGQQVRDWWSSGSEELEAKAARVAWKGSNAATERQNVSLRVFDNACNNPHPEQQIQSVDFVSSMTDSAPFLIAITLE
jgi:hypothetical protein